MAAVRWLHLWATAAVGWLQLGEENSNLHLKIYPMIKHAATPPLLTSREAATLLPQTCFRHQDACKQISKNTLS